MIPRDQSAWPVICLMGPTGIGKTTLATTIAQQLPCDIVSVDSVAVYRGLDIGTAKPTRCILAAFPHHLIDICDPQQSYSVGDFYRDVKRIIAVIRARQRIPLLVGGSMLYFRILQQGIASLPRAQHTIRHQLQQEQHTKGLSRLYAELAIKDPLAAQRIHHHDQQRILRALEVQRCSNKNLSTWWNEAGTSSSEPLPLQFYSIGILPHERTILHQHLAERLQNMLKAGFIDEVRTLYQAGLTPTLPAMRAIGYQQIWGYLAGHYTKQTMQEKTIAATRQLVKRQLTWLRHWPQLTCFYSDSQASNLATLKLIPWLIHAVFTSLSK